MWRSKFFLAVSITCLFIGGISFYGVYRYFNSMYMSEKPIHGSEDAITNQDALTTLEPHVSGEDIQTEAAAAMSSAKITPSTKLVYQYYYEEDGQMIESEEQPPYFMIDMTREEMQEKYPDWQVQSFSEEEVVMRKSVQQKSHETYRLGIHEGYVAVYYENGVIKDILDTPISALTEEERQRLEKGIVVTGEERLIRLLEDYTS